MHCVLRLAPQAVLGAESRYKLEPPVAVKSIQRRLEGLRHSCGVRDQAQPFAGKGSRHIDVSFSASMGTCVDDGLSGSVGANVGTTHHCIYPGQHLVSAPDLSVVLPMAPVVPLAPVVAFTSVLSHGLSLLISPNDSTSMLARPTWHRPLSGPRADVAAWPGADPARVARPRASP
ncbi:MAG: hypothetical protein BWY92_01136 [Firmicutes bacterium ADurb.BinA052]|nr:MAG: hypothetical protein BWY92_01136 [Firmicutes bacterium ADurb.BinA052]